MSIFTNSIDAAAEEADGYISAVLELLGDSDPEEVLVATAGGLRRRCEPLTDEQVKRPEAPGKWSAVEIVQHLADSELVWAYRLRSVAAQDGAGLIGYDQDLWATALHYRQVRAADALSQFGTLRSGNLALLDSLRPEQWLHRGVHSERGEETIEHMVRLYAGHDLVHLRQLDRVLGGLEE